MKTTSRVVHPLHRRISALGHSSFGTLKVFGVTGAKALTAPLRPGQINATPVKLLRNQPIQKVIISLTRVQRYNYVRFRAQFLLEVVPQQLPLTSSSRQGRDIEQYVEVLSEESRVQISIYIW